MTTFKKLPGIRVVEDDDEESNDSIDSTPTIASREEESKADLPLDEEFPHNLKVKPQLAIGSDAEIAQHVVGYIQAIKGRLVYTDTAFYTFNETAWQELPKTKLRRIISRWDGATYTKPGVKNSSQVQISDCRLKSILAMVADITDAPGFFDDKADGINVANGFLLFTHDGTPTLVPHSPEHKCRHTLKAKWLGKSVNVIPEGTLLHKLMYGCFKGQKNAQGMIDLISEVFGVAAAGRVKQARSPKVAIFYGDTAGNGKSQLIKLSESLLPENSISHVTPSKMCQPEYAVKMAGKLLNTANELTAAAIESDAFKHAVTGEPLQVRDLYKSTIDLHCIAQHIFATNVLPSFRGGFDHGIRRRLLVIPFTRTIPVDEQELNIGTRVGKEEADLVLAWAVAGLTRFIRQGDFSKDDACSEALNNWVLAADPVIGWYNECVTVTMDENDKIRTRDAWNHFNQWCIGAGLKGKIPALNGFSQRVKTASNQIVTPVKKPEGMFFIGIKLSSMESQWP